jgi:adenylosuccinate synthase
VIFEGAQGVLLDENYGFQPHTTWSTVTPQHALEMCEQEGCTDVTVLGVTRSYATRHGAGPFPTEIMGQVCKDEGNPTNEWQGHLRAGWLDLVLLKYAAKCCGKLDGLVVNHMDQIDRPVQVCTSYMAPYRQPFGELPGEGWWDLRHAEPVYEDMSKEAWLNKLGEIAPIVLTGNGPTWKDRN